MSSTPLHWPPVESVAPVLDQAGFEEAQVAAGQIAPDGRWLCGNRRLCRLLGYAPETLTLACIDDAIHPQDRAADSESLRRLLAGDIDDYTVTRRFLRPDGTTFRGEQSVSLLRDSSDAPCCLVVLREIGSGADFFSASAEDIAGRPQAEQSLREQHDFDRCLVTHSPLGILTYRQSGQCVLANEAAARITGGSVASLLQQNFHENPAWRSSGLYQAAQAAFREDTTIVRTVHHQSSFGKDVWMDCTLSVFVASEQKHLLLIVNDVTERLQAEQIINENLLALRETNRKLEETHHQLLQSEKMASIGQLAAGVAHELNNPIGFVQSNLGSLAAYVDDLLRIDNAFSEIELAYGSSLSEAFARVRALKEGCDHAFLIADLRQLINESREGLDRVRKIVQDLKDFTRVGDTSWQWADLHKGLDSTLNIVWNEVKYKAKVERQYGELPEIRCIPSQLNQVFMNLLANAAQAIDKRGHIIIRTGRDGARVWAEVQDDGRGIEPENRKRIFEPFFTTKPVGQGTGLGLSLSWSIVQRHHGTIEVRSAPGQGTTFRVTLPIDAPAPTPSANNKPQ